MLYPELSACNGVNEATLIWPKAAINNILLFVVSMVFHGKKKVIIC